MTKEKRGKYVVFNCVYKIHGGFEKRDLIDYEKRV